MRIIPLEQNSLLLTSNKSRGDQSVRLIKPLATLYVALLKRARGVPMWEPLRRLVGGKGEEQRLRRYGGKEVRVVCISYSGVHELFYTRGDEGPRLEESSPVFRNVLTSGVRAIVGLHGVRLWSVVLDLRPSISVD